MIDLIMMPKNFVLPIFFGYVVLSMQEKAEDCIKGKQYWSKTFINPSGACVACHFHWRNCYNEPIEDQKRCVDSCRVKPKTPSTNTKPSTSATTPVSHERPDFLPFTSTPVIFHPATHENEINEDEPRGDGGGGNHHVKTWLIIVAVILSLCAVLGVIAVVLLVRRSCRRPQRNLVNNEEEAFPLREMRQDDHEIRRIQPNVGGEEHLQRQNGEEGHLQGQNDDEQYLQRPNEEEGHHEELHLQRPNEEDGHHEELHLQRPNDEEQYLQTDVVEENLQQPDVGVEEPVARQETQPPVQATPSSLRTGGIQDSEKDTMNCSSSLDLQTEVEN